MNDRSGYTLMEIIVVIAIVSVVSSVAMDNAGSFFSGQRVQSEALTFIQDIRAARYSALANQMFRRVIFSTDFLSYRVQTYDNGGATVVANMNDAKTNFASAVWTSVIDSDSREFDPEVAVAVPADMSVIFMRPDGLLVGTPKDDGEPIPDYIATFTYGNSAVAVNINAIGVAASREYYEE